MAVAIVMMMASCSSPSPSPTDRLTHLADDIVKNASELTEHERWMKIFEDYFDIRREFADSKFTSDEFEDFAKAQNLFKTALYVFLDLDADENAKEFRANVLKQAYEKIMRMDDHGLVDSKLASRCKELGIDKKYSDPVREMFYDPADKMCKILDDATARIEQCANSDEAENIMGEAMDQLTEFGENASTIANILFGEEGQKRVEEATEKMMTAYTDKLCNFYGDEINNIDEDAMKALEDAATGGE